MKNIVGSAVIFILFAAVAQVSLKSHFFQSSKDETVLRDALNDDALGHAQLAVLPGLDLPLIISLLPCKRQGDQVVLSCSDSMLLPCPVFNALRVVLPLSKVDAEALRIKALDFYKQLPSPAPKGEPPSMVVPDQNGNKWRIKALYVGLGPLSQDKEPPQYALWATPYDFAGYAVEFNEHDILNVSILKDAHEWQDARNSWVEAFRKLQDKKLSRKTEAHIKQMMGSRLP
ncbi:MAG: hypothetical protein PHF00_06580 [Elusimicrobia bacterium]|nr:hypothetical protein [Elusimicrobiota bacterium]